MFKKFLILIALLSTHINKTIDPEDAFCLYKKYINENSLEDVLNYIYEKNPSFFIESPSLYYPITPDNIQDFIYNMRSLIGFFAPLLWGNIVFPHTLLPIESSLNKIFNAPTKNDTEKIGNADIVLISGGTYPAMKKELQYAYKKIGSKNTPLFLVARSQRKNTNIFYESYDYIVNDIEKTINRLLSNEDKTFISNNINNEYEIALIIDRFFNNGNLTIINKFDRQNFWLEFNNFLKSLKYDNANILFLSNNIFTLYKELNYIINQIDNPEEIDPQFPVIFGGYEIPLIDPTNPEGILLRKLKMITILLNLIEENID